MFWVGGCAYDDDVYRLGDLVGGVFVFLIPPWGG